jgi:D-beta-D-heptose 7-phosphate kinase/D-beta-D-heptose 1-phosphate adenosyltransferase
MFYTISSIEPVCSNLRGEGQKLVLATGFFDLLHKEHINFLQKAKSAGDVLVVAVESDLRALQAKGDGRPIETQSVRCQHILDLAGKLENWKTGVLVIALPDDFNNFDAYESLMSAIKPNIYAVSEHTTHIKSKTFLVEKYGGSLKVVHTFNPEISTTQIIKQNQV